MVLLVSVALAGCTKDEPAAQASAITPGILAGVVSDVGLTPLAGANVTVEGMNVSATTDAAGAFSFEVLPGEYVVLASLAEFKPGALRASVLSTQVSTLAFQLEAIPKLVPRIDVAEAQGYLACRALVIAAENREAIDCGERDPNERPGVEFGLASVDGLGGVVAEVAWEARTSGATILSVQAELVNGDDRVLLGVTEGTSPVSLPLPGRLLAPGTIVITVGPTGSFTDEEAGADGGLALQQPFTVYQSAFYHTTPPGGYSAITS